MKKIIQTILAKKLEWGEISAKEMTWHEAENWCKSKGDGWRLPTRIELLQAYEDKIEGFEKKYWFWSSTENSATNAWTQVFSTGAQYTYNKTNSIYVRCVREI